ncbi:MULTISPECIES: TlpA family protein disulfide reductase [unclassified Sphaerochaeta]|jgi:thiol-disulfide isomerase/thioredoxin|uniref:TlpA family protein disulfide reductase n=2 Tax=Sphaerochaeta TaxID=399320 RepID=UPI0025E80C0D|nr:MULTISPECIES: TlpA disulfide reductase family protein [unclassified Sphaerochaeta]MDX9824259.1 TlpA disulfide reductase family protein [Sphaerochaeta sp.]
MQKKTRNLVILVLSFIVLIIVASVAYNALRDSTPAVSFVPQVAALPETTEKKQVQTNISPAAVPAPSEPEPVVEDETPAVEDGVEASAPTMPNIPLFTLDGVETTFEDVRQGKPVVINYFASWCPPCKQELPHFQKAYDTYKDQISFIFLDALDGQRETLETVKAFIRDFPFTGPVYYDEGIFAYIFQTNSLPTTVFINADGTLANGYLGYVSESVLQENLDKLLTQE